jgi:enterobactin synthetase component D
MITRADLKVFSDIVDSPSLPCPTQIHHLVLAKRTECIELSRSVFASRIPDTIVRAIPKRQYEFLLGRLAAEVLLVEIGVPCEASWVQTSGRQPVWPSGITGSISHSKDMVAVSICHKKYRVQSIGIDIESLDQHASAIKAITACFTNQERERLDQIENGLIIGFSVKEALYKCLYPISGLFFDFLDAEILYVDTINQHIGCVLHRSLGAGLNSGSCFRGDFREFNNHVWTGVFLNDRDGSEFSDSAISGSLAQPAPCRARQTEEQAHEKDKKV